MAGEALAGMLAGVIEPLATALIELTVYLAAAVAAPLKFLFSSRYRQRLFAIWRERPWLPWVMIPANLLLFAAVFLLGSWFWGLRQTPEEEKKSRWAREVIRDHALDFKAAGDRAKPLLEKAREVLTKEKETRQ